MTTTTAVKPAPEPHPLAGISRVSTARIPVPRPEHALRARPQPAAHLPPSPQSFPTPLLEPEGPRLAASNGRRSGRQTKRDRILELLRERPGNVREIADRMGATVRQVRNRLRPLIDDAQVVGKVGPGRLIVYYSVRRSGKPAGMHVPEPAREPEPAHLLCHRHAMLVRNDGEQVQRLDTPLGPCAIDDCWGQGYYEVMP